MKVLLDECVNARFARHLEGFEVRHVSEIGWETIKNGDLVRLADGVFDVFVTIDKSMRHQTNLKGFQIPVVVLDVRDNSIDELLAALPALRMALAHLKPGEFHVVAQSSSADELGEST